MLITMYFQTALMINDVHAVTKCDYVIKNYVIVLVIITIIIMLTLQFSTYFESNLVKQSHLQNTQFAILYYE